ncbi:peptidoglycan-binding domain-containing protein [Seohaeicola zhoushanensis]|uniref:Peptidoglycan binding-like domain-containing protein n=1 Tax=Seohaeicola zhoushanensis TaxID=1569283 RepID=A0A8J3M8P0_9RHOB|nr:peptidoglycan-binding domain-containing protein [Seohaeicola zhoushanensis]GHF61418.1 hypothetical protein GCM10017056_36070 [Seohaeicola zhoushanensis]
MTPIRPALLALALAACAAPVEDTAERLDLLAPDDACWADERLKNGSPRRYQVPCPELQTPEFIAALQRALAVRGLYDGPPSGTMDAATAEAIRRYQAPLGIWSGKLTVEAGRKLGLVVDPPAG